MGSPNIGVSLPNIGVSSPNIGVSSPNIGVSSPNIGASSPNIWTVPFSKGRSQSTFACKILPPQTPQIHETVLFFERSVSKSPLGKKESLFNSIPKHVITTNAKNTVFFSQKVSVLASFLQSKFFCYFPPNARVLSGFPL